MRVVVVSIDARGQGRGQPSIAGGTELEFFNPAQPPPAGVNVVETGWPPGQPASGGWPNHPAGWRIVASGQAGGWVTWRKS